MKQLESIRPSLTGIGLFLALLGLSVFVRLDGVGGVTTLQDSIGPFWAALRFDGRAHATPYGIGMLLPYLLLTWTAGSLWSAICGLGWFHALVSPVAWLHCRTRESKVTLAGVLIACVVALDPGLIDTYRSGAEGYLAPLWLGVAAWVAGPFAWIAFALAVANHPLSLAGIPLLLRKKNLEKRSWWGVAAASLFVVQQAAGWGEPGVEGGGLVPAVEAYVQQGGLGAVVVLTGPLIGLTRAHTRPYAVRVLASFALLGVLGLSVGYLRDHHIRLLSVPALVCWTALSGRWAWLLMVPIFWRVDPNLPPEIRDRPGTLSLTNHIGDLLVDSDRPLTVDRAWFSGGPAVEPSAVMLDLYLRQDGPNTLSVGGDVVAVVSAVDDELAQIGYPGTLLLEGHGFYIARATASLAFAWSAQHCERNPRLGGAWDALSVLHPTLATGDVSVWWACP